MSNQQNNHYSIKIGGNVSGQVAVGPNITQVVEVSSSGDEAAGAVQSPPASPRQEIQRLYTFLNDHFNVEEVRELAFELGIDYEEVSGDNKRAKIRELIRHVDRRGQLASLAAAAKERRPQAP